MVGNQLMADEPTAREQGIIAVLLDHPAATNEEIAGVLGKSPRTIENQLRRLYKRWGIKGENKRTQLIVRLSK